MRFNNFQLTHVSGKSASDWKFKATVDVTTGFIFKKTLRREISKDYGSNWYFIDNGKFCPGFEVDELARAYAGRRGVDLQNVNLKATQRLS